MRWQTTLVLAVILAALGGFYYVYEIRMGPAREKAESAKGRVFTAESADAVELTIKRPTEIVRATREGDGWRLQDPVKARGDRSAVDETLTSIITAKIDREIDANPKSLSDFGLDKPAADVDVKLKNGKELGLVLGAKSPTGSWVYARAKDKPAVFVLPESVLRDATRPVADFRDKTVLVFDRAAVSGVDVVTGDGAMALAQSDNKWRIAKPVSLPADADAMADFLDKLGSAKVKEFVAEAPPSLDAYGLAHPARVDVHTGKEGERATKSLLFGRVDAAKKGVYAMRPDESSVLLLPEEVWTAVPKTVAAIRDKTVVAFDRDKITRLDLESPKGPVTLVRDKDEWKITAPEALPADQVEVGALLSTVAGLRAQGFLSDDASGVARYLRKPEARITLTAGQTPTTVLLAPSPESRSGKPSAYAGVAERGPVVLVEAKALGDLERSVTELRDHSLVKGMDPKDVKRMRVSADGKAMLLERKRDDEWTVVEPTRGAAKSAKVDDLLYTLRSLRWKEIAAPTGGDPAKFGFDHPTLEVALLRQDGSQIATVTLGRKEGGRTFARSSAGPAVYAVENRALGTLPKVPDDLRG